MNIIKWDYNESIKRSRKLFISWKTVSLEFIKELHGARKELDARGGDRKSKDYKSNVANATFEKYCNDVGIHRSTAHRWLERFIPEENKLLTQEEYKEIKQIEHKKRMAEETERRRKVFKEAGKKASVKQAEYNNDTKWQRQKEEALKPKEDQKEYASDFITDDFIDNLKEQNAEQKKFKEKITDANKFQDTFFGSIDEYINQLKGDTERMEALQNIIKYCKRIMIKYQQESIK